MQNAIDLARQRTQIGQQQAQVSEAERAAAPPQQEQPAAAALPLALGQTVATALQPVTQALQSDAQPQSVSLTPQDLQQVTQGVQQAGTGLSDPSQIDPNSQLLQAAQQKPIDPATFGDTLKADAKATFIDPVLSNPLETVGLLAGGIALDALSGGTLTPFLMAAGAALMLPGTIGSVAEEVKHPSDANLAHAIISGGAFASSVIPGRGVFSALGRTAGAARREAAIVTDASEVGQVTDAMGAWTRGLKPGLQLQEHDVLSFTPSSFRAQVAAKGLAVAHEFEGMGEGDLNTALTSPHKDVQTLLEHMNLLESKWDVFRRARDEMRQAGAGEDEIASDEALQGMKQEIQDMLDGTIAPLHWRVSGTHKFIAAIHGDHIPEARTEEEAALGDDVWQHAQRRGHELVKGYVEAAADHGLSPAQLSAASAMEQLQLTRNAEAAMNIANSLIGEWRGIMDHLGVDDKPVEQEVQDGERTLTIQRSPLEEALQAIEDPNVWAAAAPEVKLAARIYRDYADELTLGLARNGLIPNVQMAHVGHYFEGEGDVDPTGVMRNNKSLYEGKQLPRSAQWKYIADWNADEATVQAELKKTRYEHMLAHARQQAQVEQAKVASGVQAEHADTIKALRQKLAGHRRSVTRSKKRIEKSASLDKERQKMAELADLQQRLKAIRLRPETLQARIAQGEQRLGELAKVPEQTDFSGNIAATVGKMSRWRVPRPELMDRELQLLESLGLDTSGARAALDQFHASGAEEDWSALQDQVGKIDPHSGALEAATGERRKLQEQVVTAKEQLRTKAQLQKEIEKRKDKVTPKPLAKMREQAAAAQAAHDNFLATLHQQHGIEDKDLAEKLITRKAEEVRKLLRPDPPVRRLVTGMRHLQWQAQNFSMNMEQAWTRKVLETAGDTTLLKAKGMEPNAKIQHLGQLVAAKLRDDVVVFRGQLFDYNNDLAERNGFTQVLPAIGRPSDLGYRDALYLPSEAANRLQAALDRAGMTPEFENGIMKGLYWVTQAGRRLIMASPIFHATNLVPRLLTMITQDPLHAIPMWKEMAGVLADPVEMKRLSTRFVMAGGMKANRFNVSKIAQHALEQDTGEKHWGAFRSLRGAMDSYHQEHIEMPFWTSVHKMQLFAFRYAEEQMKLKGINPGEIEEAAAQYANHITGFVNPIYMSQMYKRIRGLMWFAPSYWGSFGNLMSSLMPFKLSEKLAAVHGGRLVRFSGAPLKFTDAATKRELLRMQRYFSYAYLGNAMVMADLMNMTLSGHHMWDNEAGHRYDIEVSKLPLVGGEVDTPGKPVRRAYWSGLGWYRQAHDVAQMLGLGHNWGFGGLINNQLQDEQGNLINFDQLDAGAKATQIASSLMSGVTRTMLGKLGPVPVAAGELATGKSILSAEDGVQVGLPLGRAGVAMNFLPAGNQVATAARVYQQAVAAATTPEERQQLMTAAAKDIGGGIAQSLFGVPSVHYVGVEQRAIGDDVMGKWKQTRDSLLADKRTASNSLMDGSISFYDYTRAKEDILQRQIQNDASTFGQEAPVLDSLAHERAALAQAYNLDQLGVPNAVWFERYSAFQQAWETLLDRSTPATKSAWWDVERATWTDADYLSWMAQQTKQALAAEIDGQGGAGIRSYEQQIGPMLGLPLNTAQRNMLEAGNPYYYQYRQTLRQLGKTSPLGAILSAFTSPIQNTVVLPPQMTPDQALATFGSQATVLLPGTLQNLVQQAKSMAALPDVESQAGELSASDVGLTGVTP